MVSVNKVGIIGTGSGLFLTALFRFYYFDIMYLAVSMHELGHGFGFGHCPDINCIMNNKHSVNSYLVKLNYGIKYCPYHTGILIQKLKDNNIKDVTLYGLLIGYQYSGNINKVAAEIQKRFNEILSNINSSVSIETFTVNDKLESPIIGNYGEINSYYIFDILSSNQIDYRKYQWFFDNVICELNNPPSLVSLDKWGFSIGQMQYAFPPAIFYSRNIFLYSLIPITLVGIISLVRNKK